VSYHDVHKTPSIARLKEIFQQCAETKADVMKIVTLAKSPEDNLKILSLIPYALKKEKKIIAFAMGEKGRISRVLAQTLGSLLGFATLEARSSSAPGQLSVAEMRKILKLVDSVKVPGSLRKGDWPPEQPQNYLLLGNPVYQSLSPLMHNAALKKMGLEGTTELIVYPIRRAPSIVSGE
jgi:3-dehydroquinate dehydratase / shikimate dehydrogenase